MKLTKSLRIQKKIEAATFKRMNSCHNNEQGALLEPRTEQ